MFKYPHSLKTIVFFCCLRSIGSFPPTQDASHHQDYYIVSGEFLYTFICHCHWVGVQIQKHIVCIWVFPKIGGKHPKWMVKIMENPMNKWMIWGYPYFWKHPYIIYTYIFSAVHVSRTPSVELCGTFGLVSQLAVGKRQKRNKQKQPIIYRISDIPGGAGFQPSTVGTLPETNSFHPKN